MPGWIFTLIQFAPLSLFATYAFWHGAPDEQRWEEAFELASAAAIIQLAIVLSQRRPASRLVLAANLYLLFGGLAFLTHQWWYLKFYDSLRETAIFIFMLSVGTVATLFTHAGYIGAPAVHGNFIKRSSVVLLLATVLALALSVVFRGDRYLAAVFPIIGLAVLQRFFLHRAKQIASAAPDN